jgi:hypothetical protein
MAAEPDPLHGVGLYGCPFAKNGKPSAGQPAPMLQVEIVNDREPLHLCDQLGPIGRVYSEACLKEYRQCLAIGVVTSAAAIRITRRMTRALAARSP